MCMWCTGWIKCKFVTTTWLWKNICKGVQKFILDPLFHQLWASTTAGRAQRCAQHWHTYGYAPSCCCQNAFTGTCGCHNDELAPWLLCDEGSNQKMNEDTLMHKFVHSIGGAWRWPDAIHMQWHTCLHDRGLCYPPDWGFIQNHPSTLYHIYICWSSHSIHLQQRAVHPPTPNWICTVQSIFWFCIMGLPVFGSI